MMRLDTTDALKVKGEDAFRIADCIVPEDRVEIFLNDSYITTQVANLDNIAELGAGYVISEGLSDHVDQVEVRGNRVFVYGADPGDIVKECSTSGGTDIVKPPNKVDSDIRISGDMIFRTSEMIVSDEWKKTGGVHCSVLFKEGEVLAKMSDIGRHNTLDKIIGFAKLNGIDLSECYVGCTGRQPSGMVSKCANAGIPIIISKAASTTGGIMTAKMTGVTLICFARDERFTVYSNEWRISGLGNK
ncbi:MAG: formate dehydrogenase accessory sulfurtransferase FdhD [Methanomicrobiaceae archaeon]|nr:formate dehydrogenase accessory sulfurtransferase FdhD [Methanomicrobiaceae archaeon]